MVEFPNLNLNQHINANYGHLHSFSHFISNAATTYALSFDRYQLDLMFLNKQKVFHAADFNQYKNCDYEGNETSN